MIDGQLLRGARKAANLTIKELADQAGLAKAFLGAIERGERPLPEKYIALFPAEIRRPVGEAAISAHEAAIERIREAINGGT